MERRASAFSTCAVCRMPARSMPEAKELRSEYAALKRARCACPADAAW